MRLEVSFLSVLVIFTVSTLAACTALGPISEPIVDRNKFVRTLPIDCSVLSEFLESDRSRLLRYLYSDARFFVTDDRDSLCGRSAQRELEPKLEGATVAALRYNLDFFTKGKPETSDRFVSDLFSERTGDATKTAERNLRLSPSTAGGAYLSEGDGSLMISSRLYVLNADAKNVIGAIGSGVNSEKQTLVFADSAKLKKGVDMTCIPTTLDDKKGRLWMHSNLTAASRSLLLNISESSYHENRAASERSLNLVLNQLGKIKAAIEAEKKGAAFDLSILAGQSYKLSSHDEVNLSPGAVWGYVAADEPGRVVLEVIPGAKASKKAFNWGESGSRKLSTLLGYIDDKSNGKAIEQNSASQIEKNKSKPSAVAGNRLRFFFALPWVLPGDGDARPEYFSLKVSFVPLEEGHMPKVLYLRPAEE